MKTYFIDKDRVSYLPAFDILYIGYQDNSLDCCDSIEDVSPGITVMLKDGEFAGAEIFEFKKTWGSLPVEIQVNANTPFILSVPVPAA